MPATTPDAIYYADGNTPLSIEAISAATATSVQLALKNRQKQSFRWAVAGEKEATEGLIGDIGYNVPDNTEYIYDGSAWKIWNKAKTEYSPVVSNFLLSTGATTISAFYSVASGVCSVDVLAILGTGTTAGIGDVTVQIPLGYLVDYTADQSTSRMILNGSVQLRNAAGTVMYGGVVRMSNTDVTTTVNILCNSATAGRVIPITPTLPFAWLTLDQLQASFTYRVA
tara:strand:+ start:1086 stop:1763 length:678 start_codon:yes stop_codon:yes gene_type:complete